VPWNETNAMELRKQFVRDVKLEIRSVKDLCLLYGISRQTGYNWIERYEQEGLADPMQGDWSADRSHAAHAVHNRTERRVEEALMQMRAGHPSWGARKLLHRVGLLHPRWELPHESTVCDMLKRNGLVQARPRRRTVGHPGRPSTVIEGPNDSWSADFKGQFRLGLTLRGQCACLLCSRLGARRSEFLADNHAYCVDNVLLLDVGEKCVIHQGLVVACAGALDLGAEMLDDGVVYADGDLGLAWLGRDDGTALSAREVDIAMRLSGDLFHRASFAVCWLSRRRSIGICQVPGACRRRQVVRLSHSCQARQSAAPQTSLDLRGSAHSRL
jgi:transposase